MAVNTAFNTQSSSSQVLGGYAQPSPGVTEAVVTPADTTGASYQTYTPTGLAAGFALQEVAQYRDTSATVQAGSTASAPSAGGTVVSVTPGAAGLWEVTGLLGITGTTVAAADSNNFRLLNGGGTVITNVTFPVQSTTGNNTQGVLPATVLNVASAGATVQVVAAGNATGSSVYAATLAARRVG